MEKANRVALKMLHTFALILSLAVWSANGQTSSQSSAGNLTSEIAGQHVFGDYVIRIRETIARPGTASMPNRLEILKGGQLVHYQVGSALSIGCAQAEIPIKSRLAIGRDITGRGKPELLIQDEHFNSSGTSDWYVFAIGDEFQPVVSLLGVITGQDRCPFRDLDGDGIPEFVVLDGTFAGFHTSHAESPLPTVVLKLKGGSYEPAPDLMRTPVPARDALARKAQAFRASTEWQAGEPPPELGRLIVDLVYGGYWALVKELLNEAWPTRLSGKQQYWLELRDLLLESRYWTQTRERPDANIDKKP